MGNLFQDEISYLRDVGREFSRLNPKLAKYLSETSTDPDVDRLMEGFAFLTSRVREKIEDEMPEFTYSVISLLWPNFLRAFPPAVLMKFTPVDRSITERQMMPRGTEILSRPVQGYECPFRTTADCPVYPLEIASSQLERTRDSARIRIFFETLSGLPLGQIKLRDLRLTFAGDLPVRQMLHLWTGRYLKGMRVVFKSGESRRINHRENLQPIGFSSAEAILPQNTTAFEGHRLLQEYFVFPDKFYGYDLVKLDQIFNGSDDTEFELELEYERPLPNDVKLRPDSIQLYCIPAVNLFEADADPLIVDHRKVSYRVRPHGVDPEKIEIFSIDRVGSHFASADEARLSVARTYPAFESFEHEIGEGRHGEQVYYRQRAKKSLRLSGFEHEISFVLHNSEHAVPPEESLSMQLSCFNRGIAAELGVGDIGVPTENSPVFVTYANITRPTAPVYPPLDGTLNWNLISNLSLNYMSLLDRDALAAILSVYDYRSLTDRQAERAARQRLEGIRKLTTTPFDRLFKGLPIRGLKSRMVMRESSFQTEGEMYLFASVLAEFFALYSTVNSFHELEVLGEENGEIYKWPARIGRQPLI
ncbi:type VI secretion system baseplate subunit TssF [Phyllobacterium leguminum]|uniref:Type VI secretion system protein ImpG n=1 Tax=Phyllobacterium leguminum TaxID=314237 RepID=A0A318SUD2_9HYPH|nr:type VI secretion system baseplate subunit TssF [Phyllobacterium leguminum]PYE85283.1 type VI secretion system protein ImpG [Phyllobacterium leguminum]